MLRLVVDERVGEGVPFVGAVVLAGRFVPVVVRRKERVGLCRGVVNLGETETVGEGQGLLVDRGSADDVDLFIRGAVE